jgi:hypothetical protein
LEFDEPYLKVRTYEVPARRLLNSHVPSYVGPLLVFAEVHFWNGPPVGTRDVRNSTSFVYGRAMV